MEMMATEEVEVVLGNNSPNYGTAPLATSFGMFPFLQRLNLMSETRLVYIPIDYIPLAPVCIRNGLDLRRKRTTNIYCSKPSYIWGSWLAYVSIIE